MDTNSIPNDFITKSFNHNNMDYKMAYTPELIPTATGLDFTGNFIGLIIGKTKGTSAFQKQQHPDKIWECGKAPLDKAAVNFPYHFTLKSFEHKGEVYKLVMTPELAAWEEDDGLEFTGCYLGILSSIKMGTVPFQLIPTNDSWESEPEKLEQGLIDKLDEIIAELRQNNFPETVR